MIDVPERIRTASSFLRRLELRNAGMLSNTLSIMTAPSAKNYWYNRDLVVEELPRAARNFVLDPEAMNDFQRHSPVAAYTSTPEDALLAGFTRHGRLCTLFYPHTGFTQQVPYFETDDGYLWGSKPREGGFFGVRLDGDVRWLWEAGFEHDVSPRARAGMVDIGYRGEGIDAEETAYVLPGAETLARDLVLENVGDRAIDSVVYYTQINVNDELQYPPGVTHDNRAVAGEELHWWDLESDRSLRVVPAANTTVRSGGVAESTLDGFLDSTRSIAEGHYLGGYLEFEARLAPGDRTNVSVFTTGRDDVDPESGTFASAATERQRHAENRWREYLDPIDTAGIADRFVPQYERSIAALLMLYDPESGSISAAPSVQPAYYPSWPRDGAFAALALARAGKSDVATDYLGRFLPRVQESDGGFSQCYASTGDRAGIIPRSDDQQALYVLAVRSVYEETGDTAFLETVWPAVERALEYTVDAIVDNGLLEATPDFAEMWSDARQSLWTNALAYRALLDGAALARKRGEDGSRYRSAATEIGDAIEEHFFASPEAFVSALTISGSESRDRTAFSVTVFPSGWALDYGRVGTLLDAFADAHAETDEHWLPEEFLYAGALYHVGALDRGDDVLSPLATETIPGGTLAEVVDEDGEYPFAALGWSNATFLLAVQERARTSTD